MLPQTFTRPPGFTLEQRETTRRARWLCARCSISSAAYWVREFASFFTVAEQPRDDGLLVTLRVRHERDVLQWLLGWGSHVRVLEPDSLRAQMARPPARCCGITLPPNRSS